MKKNEFSVVSTGVFDRCGNDTVSANAFYAIMTIVLCEGLGITAFFAHYAIQIGFMPSWWSFIGLGLIVPILGIILSIKSENPILSFIGYNMVAIPFGFLLGPVVQQYSPSVVQNAFVVTAGITFLMGLAGTLFPNFFRQIGGFLFVSLFGLLVVRIVQIFVPALDLTVIDYIAAGIFSLYIGYDMYRANTMTKTVDNAVDICVDLYLDIINLFINILKIMGKKS
ncbi:MAG: Bax inhibitor-1 family protein [Candidatus Peribacteria bacterium]|jgi:FtsH-binding integral membrane protein|nr:Bax inhibitor-1 family protein [Candidatus Peribacteria bacterium]